MHALEDQVRDSSAWRKDIYVATKSHQQLDNMYSVNVVFLIPCLLMGESTPSREGTTGLLMEGAEIYGIIFKKFMAIPM